MVNKYDRTNFAGFIKGEIIYFDFNTNPLLNDRNEFPRNTEFWLDDDAVIMKVNFKHYFNSTCLSVHIVGT